MTEGDIKSDLMIQIRIALPPPSWVCIRHEDHYTFGVPDLSVTGIGMTSWWEVKHAHPRIAKSRGIQQRLAEKLERAGYCRYIVYYETEQETERGIYVVRPSKLITLTTAMVKGEAEYYIEGWDHRGLARHIGRVHQQASVGRVGNS